MIAVRQNADSVTFAVRVQPRAKRNAISGVIGDALKVSLTAPPLDGRANEALIALLADHLNVARSAVTILSGLQSRDKVVRIAGVAADRIAGLG